MKKNTIIVVLIILLVILLGFVLIKNVFQKKPEDLQQNIFPSVEQTQNEQNVTDNSNNNLPNNNQVSSGQNITNQNLSKAESAFGVSVVVPEGFDFSIIDGYGASSLIKGIHLSKGKDVIVAINKFPNQALFNESVPGADYGLPINNNYSVGGENAVYYDGDLMEDIIAVPSKFVIIRVSPIPYEGFLQSGREEFSQSDIDQILTSISFQF
jgi:hypothetical protein